MPTPVAYNNGSRVDGAIQDNSIDYIIEGDGRNYRGGYGGLSWMSEHPAEGGVVFIGNTTNIGRGPAGKPVFYKAISPVSESVLAIVNGLPGSPRNFTNTGSAYSWALSNNFFLSKEYYPTIASSQMVLYMDATQAGSYPRTGTTWYNLGGSPSNGTLTNGPAWTRDRWFDFDGTNDYCPVGTLAGTDEPFTTVTATIRRGADGWNGAWFGFGTAAASTQDVYFWGGDANRQFGFNTWNGDSWGFNSSTTAGRVMDGTWHHLTAVFNRNDIQSSKIYIDGDEQALSQVRGTTLNRTVSTNFGIGLNGWETNSQLTNGDIANIQVYTKELSASEIVQNYYKANIITDGLVRNIDFSNLVCFDSSSYTNPVELTNKTTTTLYNGPGFVNDFGGGMLFDPVDDFMAINDSTNLTYVTTDLFYTRVSTSGSGDRIIINKESCWEIRDDQGSLQWALMANNQGWFWQPTGATMEVGETAHIALSYDGNFVRFYKNGSLVQKYTYPSGGVLATNSSVPMFNARGSVGSPFNFGNRTLYSWRIYNRALSDGEVLQNYLAFPQFQAPYGSYMNPAPSAEAILQKNSNAPSGLYHIKPTGYTGEPIMVYCDMTTDGGGWMHVGTINDNGEASNNPTNHPWGAPLNPTQNTGIWEDSTTLGGPIPQFTSDYKSKAWSEVPFTQLLIKDRGEDRQNLLYTADGQISSNNTSLSAWFGSLQWLANGSETSTSAYNNGRVTTLDIVNFSVADAVLDSGNKDKLLFKFGEYDGAQDGNKDRTMIAWHRYNQPDNVDAPSGLGNFTNRGGAIDYRDVVPYAQRADFPNGTITGGPYNYSLWVR